MVREGSPASVGAVLVFHEQRAGSGSCAGPGRWAPAAPSRFRYLEWWSRDGRGWRLVRYQYDYFDRAHRSRLAYHRHDLAGEPDLLHIHCEPSGKPPSARHFRAYEVDLLEAHEGDLELKEGKVMIKGAADRAVSLRQVAGHAHWNATTLVAAGIADPFPRVTATVTAPHLKPPDPQDRVNTSFTFAFIADIVAVEVEPATGAVRILKYVSVHDAGRIVNPMIAEGQIAGSIVHGVGGALYEELVYDRNGHPLTGSFKDYLCPTAVESPAVEVAHLESLSPFTTLGTKGLGEGSSETAPAAIVNAVADALAPLGVAVPDLPLTPVKLWTMIQGARKAAAL